MDAEKDKAVCKRRKWPWIAIVALLALIVVLIFSLPCLLVSITYPTLEFDLSPFLKGEAETLVSNKTVTAGWTVERDYDDSYRINVSGVILDWPFSARINVLPEFYFFGVNATGDAEFRLIDTEWMISARFEASSSGAWQMSLGMEDTPFSGNDPVIGRLLAKLPMSAMTNLVFGGKVGFSAKAECTSTIPVPRWSAACRVKEMDVGCVINGKPVEIRNLRFGTSVSGIADHVDIGPIFPRADQMSFSLFAISNVFASIRATERAFLVTEAGAKFCGGDVKLYSFFLDSARLDAGVTVFVDGIDAGETLRCIKTFKGEASGKLYGKMPLYLKGGKELRLRNAYLHSVPGETGELRVYDAKPIMDNLAASGVPQATCDNLSKALANLTYSVLKVSLQPEDDGGMALSLKISGTATQKGVTVPVTLQVTFHGDLEQLVNTGIKTINMAKGEK